MIRFAIQKRLTPGLRAEITFSGIADKLLRDLH